MVSAPADQGRILLDNTEVLETATNPDSIGTLSVTGPYSGDSYTFTIISDPDTKFDIGGVGSDELIVESGATFDFETSSSHNVTVRATGPTKTYERTFIISVIAVSTNRMDFSSAGNSQYIPLLGPLG